jgi:hypothetical protein
MEMVGTVFLVLAPFGLAFSFIAGGNRKSAGGESCGHASDEFVGFVVAKKIKKSILLSSASRYVARALARSWVRCRKK